MNIREWIAGHNDEAMMADGFEDAIIGICGRFGANPVVAYDRDKCIEILAKDMAEDSDDPPETVITDDVWGVTIYTVCPFSKEAYAEAEEYFEFNVIGAYVGENTPVFVTLYNPGTN